MATTTENLKLKKPLESDYFNINDFNGNMDKIDALTHIIASGTSASSKYKVNSTTVTDGTVTWYYKKYSDGTLEAQCAFTITDLKCNGKKNGTYQSGSVIVNYPSLGQKTIYYKNASCASSSGSSDVVQNWVMDCSAYGESKNYQTFRLVSPIEETNANAEKVIYLEFKGTWK